MDGEPLLTFWKENPNFLSSTERESRAPIGHRRMAAKKKKGLVRKSALGADYSGPIVTFRMLPPAQVKKAAGVRWAKVGRGKNPSVSRIKSLYKTAGYDPIGATQDGVVIVKPLGKPSRFTVQRLERAITGVRGSSS
jgi:hypothetical protein